jgi:5-methyltetrahydropteroyltriglutamate--homocysteine methyltransferase
MAGMKRSSDRILTTHCGSLARPHELLDAMKARLGGEQIDETAYSAGVREAVQECVEQQVANEVDIVSDGEQSKPGFSAYVRERLSGFEPTEPDPNRPRGAQWARELAAFPEYYAQYFGGAMRGVAPSTPLVCTGPVSYQGSAAVAADIVNLQSAIKEARPIEAFLPAIAPRPLGKNQYYSSDEEYIFAIAGAMREEYLAITGAGLLLQIDDPALTDLYAQEQTSSEAERRWTAEMYIDALNYAIRDIPREQVRFHTCYGINEGPRIHDTPLGSIVDLLFRVNAGAYSFEAANARHQHEWHVFEKVKPPENTILIPGMVTHASNIVEHPELIADLLVTYARLVGRENVIAGSDCGFSSQATYTPEVHPTVVWAKFQALAEGARLASERLWS